MRFIKLDKNNMIITVRTGLEIVENEIQSDIGECGDIMQEDGTFINATPLPQLPDKILVLQNTVTMLQDRIGVLQDKIIKFNDTILLDRFGDVPDFTIEDLKRMYQAGRLTELKLTAAVTKGWITAKQKIEIMTP
jgi:hypothetical protein